MADGDLMPSFYVNEMPWNLMEEQGVRMQRSGNSQVLRLGEPHWAIEVLTSVIPPGDRAAWQTWDAWLTDRRGAASTFLASDLERPKGLVPVASDSGLTVTGIDRAAATVSFGSTGTWTATKGDKVGYYTAAGGYWLGMVMETKSASGGAMTALKVHPPPFTPHASVAAPKRISPVAEFQIRQPKAMPVVRVDDRRVSFTADQIIRG